MRKPTGITHKLIRVYVLQMLFISVITVLGVYVAATIVEKVMIRAALEAEADYFWEKREHNSDHPLPNSHNLLGFMAVGDDYQAVPLALRAAVPGTLVRLQWEGREPIVYSEQRDQQRLILVFDEESVGKLSFYFGVVPLSLALLVIYLSAWLAYRSSYRTLSPMISLAQTMRGFDLNKDDLNTLQFDDYIRPGVDDEVRVLADSLREFTARLKQQLQREQAFTRDVSHELRTPLAVIRGSLEMLEKQPLTALQQRAVTRMNTTSRDMLSLIETLLLLARDSLHDALSHEGVVVNDVAKLLIEQVADTHNHDQHVQLSMQATDLLVVAAPAQAIGIVLGNLLRNACNYTPNGSVMVSIDAQQVTISDTGVGMQAGELNRLQQAFERSGQHVDGYGLGLDIVHRLCERYQWQMVIDSQAGQGTSVQVRFIPAA